MSTKIMYLFCALWGLMFYRCFDIWLRSNRAVARSVEFDIIKWMLVAGTLAIVLLLPALSLYFLLLDK